MSMNVVEINHVESPSDLVARIIAGDRQAEEALIRRYHQAVKIIIDRVTGYHPASEDLCQETFKAVWQNIRHGKLEHPERLSGYIRETARRIAIHHVGHIHAEPPMGPATAEDIPDPAPNQLDRILQQEESEFAWQVLQELKPREREVLIRFYIAGEEKERICADLGIANQNFNVVIHRARERFIELYEKRRKDSGR
jgi:RNA polymerase sigma-70 factor (ECF subfamily)